MTNKKAFTLIEIMVVVSIVTIAFVSIIGLVQRAMVLFYNNRNVMIANNLAQEGLEMVRFVRDDNWMIPKTYSGDVSFNYFARDININQTETINIALGNKAIFAIDSRVLNDEPAKRYSIRPFFKHYGTTNESSVGTCNGEIKDCVKLSFAKLYKNKISDNNFTSQYLHTLKYDTNGNFAGYNDPDANTDQTYTNFNRLIITEYRDGGESSTSTDDYLHVESWVYWQDHGKDKYFHLDTDLYDYAWRKPD